MIKVKDPIKAIDILGPFIVESDSLDFVLESDSIKETDQARCHQLECNIKVTEGRIHIMFPHSMKGQSFGINLYQDIVLDEVITTNHEIEWDRGNEMRGEPSLELGKVFSIYLDNNDVVFEENCDHWFGETMTKANAIRLLEEAIEFIRGK